MTKIEWQKKDRKAFKEKFGYSKNLFYRFGGNRQEALERDSSRCVKCGMTDEQHEAKWGRPITVDHIDKDATNNDLNNLQVLYLSCHGSKDILKRLTVPKCIFKKAEIILMRQNGKTYQQIAGKTGFSIAAIYKWIQIWKNQTI